MQRARKRPASGSTPQSIPRPTVASAAHATTRPISRASRPARSSSFRDRLQIRDQRSDLDRAARPHWRAAVLDTGTVKLVVTERKREPWDLGVFESVRIDPRPAVSSAQSRIIASRFSCRSRQRLSNTIAATSRILTTVSLASSTRTPNEPRRTDQHACVWITRGKALCSPR